MTSPAPLPRSFFLELEFAQAGPSVSGRWTDPETADRKFREWLGTYGSGPDPLRQRRSNPGKAVRPLLLHTYDAVVRNTKAFKEAVAQTLAELARKGVTLAPATVEDTIEERINTVSQQLGIQVRSAWRYFDASAMADSLAKNVRACEDSSAEKDVGHAPMPPPDNPELALVLAGVPDSLAQTGGDLYAVIISVAVKAWMAGHIHGEDGCTGCDGSRGPAGHDWEARMRTITEMQPTITKWFDRDVWTAAVNDTGFTVTRR
ncbi:hypothetical protein [Streptomyces sp. NPDC050485]|uniref:hypothetical protein n=1 Tax=Streptomyces sp. NPDC050485 TaxID=3365617 RepID=UPI0037AC2B0F